MINLNQLELKNFFSHVDTKLTLDNYEGLVLVEGLNTSGFYSSNGSGKSTLLEGIIYALTGDTLRGVSVNDIINRNHKKNTLVSLQFHKDDVPYSVSRYRKDDIYGDSIVLAKNGEDISKRVNKETQKSLDDILGISYKILVSTMLLGEGLSSRFTQLSDPEKKSLIESTLNLNYDISAIRAKANNALSQLKLQKSTLEGRLEAMRELSSLDVDTSQKLVEEYQANTAKAAKELEDLQGSLAAMKDNYNTLCEKVTLLRNTLVQYDNWNTEICRLNEEFSHYLGELERLEHEEVPHCSTCRQALASAESRDAFYNSYKEKIDNVSKKIEELRKHMSNLPDRSIIEDKYNILSKEVESSYQLMVDMNSKISAVASQRWEAQSQVDKLNDQIKRYQESTENITVLEEEKNALESDIAKYEYFYQLYSPTGIIVHVLSDAIDYINTRLSTYSSILLEKDYRLNFVKGKISLVDSKGASYQSLSNGEKRRLDISIQFAMHDYVHSYCGMKMDCCFIDEILDTLDDIGVENIFEVLRLKLDYCQLKSIYVITHNNALKDKFDQVITVKKDAQGDSYLS